MSYVIPKNEAIFLKHIDFIDKILPSLCPPVRKSTTHLTIVIMHCWQMMANKFYTYKTDYWCSRPSNFANFTVEDWRNLSTPWKTENNNEFVFDNCKIFNVTFTTISTRPDENTKTIPAIIPLTYLSKMGPKFGKFALSNISQSRKGTLEHPKTLSYE